MKQIVIISDIQYNRHPMFLHLLFFLGQWRSFCLLIYYSNIVCIFSLFTGMTRSVIITLTSQVLRQAWVISLRLFGPTAGSLELVTPLERTPNFPDMYAST